MNSPLSRFSDTDRALQTRYLVTRPTSPVARRSGLTSQTVNALKRGDYPVSVFRAYQFAEIQQDFRLVTILAERAGAILLPRHPSIVHWSNVQLLAQFVISFGRFLVLAEKIREGVILEDDEDREAEDLWQQMRQTGDALMEKKRQQQLRRKQIEDATKDTE